MQKPGNEIKWGHSYYFKCNIESLRDQGKIYEQVNTYFQLSDGSSSKVKNEV